MDTFTEKVTGLKFCVNSNTVDGKKLIENGISSKSLIDWCHQYINKDTNLLDIGSGYGKFSLVLSKSCKKVYSFEFNDEKYQCLSISIAANNIFNVELIKEPFSSTPIDSYNYSDIGLIILSEVDDELSIIKSGKVTLYDNKFPPIVFSSKDRALVQYLINLGYKIHPVGGYEGVFLASDNPFYQTQVKPKEFDTKELMEKDQDTLTWDEILHLCYHQRCDLKDNNKCYELALLGLKKCPDNSRYLFYKEISIVAFYIKKMDVGFQACENVVLSHAPWNCRNMTLANQAFYMTPLQMKKKIHLRHPIPLHYVPTSASIIPNGNGYRINLRCVNYYLSNEGYGVSRHGDGIIKTINYLLNTDKMLDITNSVELVDNSGVKRYPKNILGMEDIRLFGDNYFFCTYLELNEKRTPQIGWGTYDPESGSVTRMVPLMVGKEVKCEKNWLPFIDDDGEIYFIYALGPFQLYKLDKETGEVKEIKRRNLHDDLLDLSPVIVNEMSELRNINGFRGSAAPIKYKDYWLFSIHQVHHNEPRKYFHRLVAMDKYFDKIMYSKPFYFDKVGVEFNLSLSHNEEGLMIAYSHDDSTSTVGIVDYDIVDKMLNI